MTGAAPASAEAWDPINWSLVAQQVRRLQQRIAKATQQGKQGKVKALQRLLTHSHCGRLTAIKRVTENAGARTPGIDGSRWTRSTHKIQAAQALRGRGYHAVPLRRLYIPKSHGKRRPLGIPTMKDRAMQALHLLALEPLAEIRADKHSYGFRPERCAADAIGQCFLMLARKQSAQWILEGDIQSCFDAINHQWLLDHIPMDTRILRQWIAAGYIEEDVFYDTEAGTPQGGIISPVLANMTLDGLEEVVQRATTKTDRCYVVRYADDFVITGGSKAVLEQTVKPVVTKFLTQRGLQLSTDKTAITHIDDGFDFLGCTVRKYNGKLLIKPAKTRVKRFLDTIRTIIKSHPTIKTESLIRLLNPKLRGWANYYRHVVAKKVFGQVDDAIFKALCRWTRRRHPQRSAAWLRKKYFRHPALRGWWFHARIADVANQLIFLRLFELASVKIQRHVNIRAAATPYDVAWRSYFEQRHKRSSLLKTGW